MAGSVCAAAMLSVEAGSSAAGMVDVAVVAKGAVAIGAVVIDVPAVEVAAACVGGVASSARAEGSDCAHAVAAVTLNSATLIHWLNVFLFTMSSRVIFPNAA